LKDEVKERIKFNIEIIKVLILLFVASGGGAISLVLDGLPRGRHVVLAAGGMIFALTSGVFAWKVYIRTIKLLKNGNF
jgi:hypothetical protein